jgi:hypothetical protein
MPLAARTRAHRRIDATEAVRSRALAVLTARRPADGLKSIPHCLYFPVR